MPQWHLIPVRSSQETRPRGWLLYAEKPFHRSAFPLWVEQIQVSARNAR